MDELVYKQSKQINFRLVAKKMLEQKKEKKVKKSKLIKNQSFIE